MIWILFITNLSSGHAPRERVSWNSQLQKIPHNVQRHAPRERVSWNVFNDFHTPLDFVTLHVSVWVEMTMMLQCWKPLKRHAPRERVSWNELLFDTVQEAAGHAPRERVSWNHMWPCCHRILIGHAPRERVSWNCKILNLLLTNVVTLHVSVWVEMTKL